MSKDFTNFKEAMGYAAEMKAKGFGAYVEEFYTFDGKVFSVLVWEK